MRIRDALGMGNIQKHDSIESFVDEIDRRGMAPDVRTIAAAPTETEVSIDGRTVVMFGSNNYLGLATRPEVKEAVAAAALKYGNSSGGSRWVSGTTDIQLELEEKLAEFKRAEASITFAAGYMANLGAMAPLTGQMMIDDALLYPDFATIFSDELNHASIIDGCRLVNAKKVVYRHADPDDLRSKLRKVKRKSRKMIITDGVFSMDGDIAPLDAICDAAEEYGADVYCDDAHGTGVLGENGRGTPEHFGVEDRVAVSMGTFTKAFGGFGGYITGSAALVRYLRMTARAYIFTAPIPPAVCAGLIQSLALAKDNGLREKLGENTRHFLEGLEKLGYRHLGGQTAITPVLIGDEQQTKELSDRLFVAGYFAPFVRFPAVAKGQARLRVTMMATHSKEQIDGLLSAMEEAGPVS
ncbi:MAG: aminotransferase class I/II-fold pyridoxal phosphate-dependent enzyme [Planctomycetota bacterium]